MTCGRQFRRQNSTYQALQRQRPHDTLRDSRSVSRRDSPRLFAQAQSAIVAWFARDRTRNPECCVDTRDRRAACAGLRWNTQSARQRPPCLGFSKAARFWTAQRPFKNPQVAGATRARDRGGRCQRHVRSRHCGRSRVGIADHVDMESPDYSGPLDLILASRERWPTARRACPPRSCAAA